MERPSDPAHDLHRSARTSDRTVGACGGKEGGYARFQGQSGCHNRGCTGIGFALAKQFAQRGAQIVLAARRRDRLEEAAGTLAAMGCSDVRTFQRDVTQRDQVKALADFGWQQFRHVDVIVNNAGIGPIMSSVIEAKRDDVQRVLDVNLFGVWNGVSVFGRRFLAQGTAAAIYNVGSENCFFNAVPRGAGYIASKHALLAMTYALREELPDYIKVGIICPGLVRSELSRETNEGMDTDKFAALATRQILAGEFLRIPYRIPRLQHRPHSRPQLRDQGGLRQVRSSLSGR